MKKLLILIVLALGLYPMLEHGKWGIGLQHANAQTYPGESQEEFENFYNELEEYGLEPYADIGTISAPDMAGEFMDGTIMHIYNSDGDEVMTLFRPYEDHGNYSSDQWYTTMIVNTGTGTGTEGGGGEGGFYGGYGGGSDDPDDPDDTYYPPYTGGGYGGGGANPGGGNNEYTLTTEDIDLINLVQQENTDEDNIVANQLDCYGTGRTGNLKFPGTVEHWLIQFDYVNSVLGGVREYSIPGAGPTGGRGYADIANTFTNEMFEIKPTGTPNKNLAIAEGGNYVIKANENCPPASGSWHMGTNYPPTGKVFPHPTQPGKVVLAELTAPGVIQYQIMDLVNSPQPIPVLMPESLAEKLKNFVRLLATSTGNVETQIVYFLRKNPEIVPYIKGAAIGVVIGTIVEDIATSGVGVADDWASFVLARTMWRLAAAM
jgi:hypothetical protein